MGLGCCLAAAVTAVQAPSPHREPMSPELDRQAFETLEGQEAELRRQAVEDFATDAWSQEDAFGAFEGTKAYEFANQHHVSAQHVFRAVDEGLRAHWPLPPGAGAPHVTVTPLRPRPFD